MSAEDPVIFGAVTRTADSDAVLFALQQRSVQAKMALPPPTRSRTAPSALESASTGPHGTAASPFAASPECARPQLRIPCALPINESNSEQLIGASEMDRTQEFVGYLAFGAHAAAPRARLSGASDHQFASAAKDIKSRLEHCKGTMDSLAREIHAMDSIDEGAQQSLGELVKQLQVGLSDIDSRIRALEQMNPRPPNAGMIIHTLRQTLWSIGSDFKKADDERKEKVDNARNRRRRFCGHTNYRSFDVTYDPEDPGEQQHLNQAVVEAQRERYDAVLNIERSITEVLHVFTQLHDLIEAQGYNVMRIDQDVGTVLENFESGKRELEKYYEKVKSNKWLFMKIGAVLFVFILVFILIV